MLGAAEKVQEVGASAAAAAVQHGSLVAPPASLPALQLTACADASVSVLLLGRCSSHAYRIRYARQMCSCCARWESSATPTQPRS